MTPDLSHIEIDPLLVKFKSWIEQTLSNEKSFILVDENTQKHCLPVLTQLSPVFANSIIMSILPGEEHKTMAGLNLIFETLTNHQAGRKSILISLGGGVVCDMGGFAASIYKRGIRSVLLPTTLLAQVDAAYGGKTGIDFMGHKNLIGSFSFPEKIFVSPLFLATLPELEKLNGLAEALKHGLIADRDYWNKIKDHPFDNVEQLIRDSIRIKTSIVEKDPGEKNIRKILNAGHTVGHAIESAFLLEGKPISHGQAVVAGLMIELYLSNKKGYLNDQEMNETIQSFEKFFPKLPIESFEPKNLIQLMRQDKKNTGTHISFSLIRKIGEASFDDHISEELIETGINYYISR
jgi:3-dehydroquinate synthase